MTDVKEMTGTEDFFNLDVEVRQCQNKESVLECQAKKYLEMGKEKCECVPHHLRGFAIKVRHNFRTSDGIAVRHHQAHDW